MMHTLGFDHEHMRPDRDQYVRIIHKNINSYGKKVNAKTILFKSLCNR